MEFEVETLISWKVMKFVFYVKTSLKIHEILKFIFIGLLN